MKHIFKATILGWKKEQEIVWVDADDCTKEEAFSVFKKYKAFNQRGYEYTGYEYDGQKYHDITYLGLYEDEDAPHNESEFLRTLDKRKDK